MDRTAEFRQIAAARQAHAHTSRPSGSLHPPPPPQRPPAASETLRPRSEFAAGASRVGADIHATAEKLAKLTRLAQSNALLLFADPTEEINALTLIIKQVQVWASLAESRPLSMSCATPLIHPLVHPLIIP